VALLEQVVTIRERTLTEEDPPRLASQHALAGAYRSDGQVKKAVALLEEGVAAHEKRSRNITSTGSRLLRPLRMY
jgi:hypothetical protein